MKIVIIDDNSDFIRQVARAVMRHTIYAEDFDSVRFSSDKLSQLRQKVNEAELIFLDHNIGKFVYEIVDGRPINGKDVFDWICSIIGRNKALRITTGISNGEQNYLARQLQNSGCLRENDVDDFLDNPSGFPHRFQKR